MRAEELTLRWIGRSDVIHVVDLHKACFGWEKWTKKDISDFATKDRPHQNVFKVISTPDRIVRGSLLYSIEKDGTCRIRRIAVWPDDRRKGIASFALGSLFGPTTLFRSARRFTASLKNRPLVAAQPFFESFGFKLEGDPAELLFVFNKPAS